jgi:hypothetical protein
MTFNSETSIHDTISAFSFSGLPEHDDIRFSAESDLEEMQVYASRINELADLILEYKFPDYPVIFCKMQSMRGCVYMEEDFSYPLIFLDSSKANSVESLRETYIHEAAHLLSDGYDHDFAFAVAYNSLRHIVGLGPSNCGYDYRAIDFHGYTIDEKKRLCSDCVNILIDSDVPIVVLLENIKSTISVIERETSNYCQREEIIAKFANYSEVMASTATK